MVDSLIITWHRPYSQALVSKKRFNFRENLQEPGTINP